ncbi:MAG: hypothetical protein HQM00_15140, partial [Magnetococcales bacterium]|nr:hypothetical protein [Magnetococcales bacterium]
MNNRSLIRIAFFLLMLWQAANGFCADFKSHQLQLGIKMFPALVGGNLDLSSQKNKEGALSLLIVYEQNRDIAEQMAHTLDTTVKIIDKFPIQVVVCP